MPTVVVDGPELNAIRTIIDKIDAVQDEITVVEANDIQRSSLVRVKVIAQEIFTISWGTGFVDVLDGRVECFASCWVATR